jgi:HD superfamily phosphohydrolase
VPENESDAPALAIDGAKGIPAIESFLLARLFMFQQVYFHKTERACEWMLARILERARELLADGTRLPGSPPGIIALAGEQGASLGQYLELDDPSLWVALSAWEKGPDPLLADLVRRLLARRLFKTEELYGEAATPEGRLLALEAAREAAEAAGLDPKVHVGLDVASTVAFDDLDDPLTVVFPSGDARSLAEVSFLLGRLRGERMERVRLIFAPELRDPMRRITRDRRA